MVVWAWTVIVHICMCSAASSAIDEWTVGDYIVIDGPTPGSGDILSSDEYDEQADGPAVIRLLGNDSAVLDAASVFNSE